MSFDVAAERYDRFMGRYSAHLSSQMADLAGVTAGQRALDVGCGLPVRFRRGWRSKRLNRTSFTSMMREFARLTSLQS